MNIKSTILANTIAMCFMYEVKEDTWEYTIANLSKHENIDRADINIIDGV